MTVGCLPLRVAGLTVGPPPAHLLPRCRFPCARRASVRSFVLERSTRTGLSKTLQATFASHFDDVFDDLWDELDADGDQQVGALQSALPAASFNALYQLSSLRIGADEL